MAARKSSAFQRTLAALQRYGFLLETDSSLPSVTCLVAEEPVGGSWWAHPLARAIFEVNCLLADHPEVLICKLISGKVTFVHRPFWEAVVAVASAREPWQVQDLSKQARSLLDRVTRQGEVRTDRAEAASRTKGKSLGEAARELERKLLVYSEQVHTDKGAHAKILQTWKRWSSRVGLTRKELTSEAGKKMLEAELVQLNRQFEANGRLPWRAS